MDRDSYRPALIRDSSRYRLSDPPRRVGRELVAAVIFELVDRLDKTDISFADDVFEIKSAVVVLFRDADNESQVSLNQLVFRAADSLFSRSELFGICRKLFYRKRRLGFEFLDAALSLVDKGVFFADVEGIRVDQRELFRICDDPTHVFERHVHLFFDDFDIVLKLFRLFLVKSDFFAERIEISLVEPHFNDYIDHFVNNSLKSSSIFFLCIRSETRSFELFLNFYFFSVFGLKRLDAGNSCLYK